MAPIQGIDGEALFRRIRDLVIRTFSAAREPMLRQAERRPFAPACFELFGIDVLIDAELKPWLIEVNVSPSLGINSAEQAQAAREERMLKEKLVRDLFRLVGVDSPPPTLDSEEAVAAHYEAEQARSGGFQRIYPAADADRWLSCLTWPRRLDLLLAHHVCPAVPLDPPPLRTQKIRALPLGEELVLVSEEPGTVRAVNATAGYTWLRIEEEASTEEIAAELAERFGQPLARVRANVDAVVAQWIEAGLVDLAETSTEKSVSRTTRRFALAGLALEVTLPADVAPIAGVIAPDATGKEPLVGAVEVLPQVRGYLLRTGEGIALSCDNEDGLGPALRDLLVQRVAHRTPHSNFAIPASAVRSKSGAVLILGPNDSERSRVALACALTGMDLVCDELALLDARFSVLPHALPPSLPGTICGFEIPSFRQAKSD